MKVWLVLALLAMGLGCSEEPPEPWPSALRVVFVEGCIDVVEDSDPGLVRRMAAKGITPRDLCRCVLYELERQYTESDMVLLGPDEAQDAGDKATRGCREEMLYD